MKKKLLFLLLGGLLTLPVFSQKLARQSISCVGGTMVDEGISIQQTIGQSSSTLTFGNGRLALRQGFLQPVEGRLSEKNGIIESIQFDLFPNPFQDYFSLKISDNLHIPFDLIVTDAMGVEVVHEKVIGGLEYFFDLNQLASGVYFVLILFYDELHGVSKLIKI